MIDNEAAWIYERNGIVMYVYSTRREAEKHARADMRDAIITSKNESTFGTMWTARIGGAAISLFSVSFYRLTDRCEA